MLDQMRGGGVEEQLLKQYVPPGLRFIPTDEELLTFYLKNRVDEKPPNPMELRIPTLDVYSEEADPWVLQKQVAFPYGKGNEFYCFTRRSQRGQGARRTAGSGTWAAKGKNVRIMAASSGELVGHRLMLSFMRPAGDNIECTNWIMHEYRLPDGDGSCSPGQEEDFQELVLCRILRR